jgi:hypothetical protein
MAAGVQFAECASGDGLGSKAETPPKTARAEIVLWVTLLKVAAAAGAACDFAA